VLLAAKSAPPAIRALLVERAALIESSRRSFDGHPAASTAIVGVAHPLRQQRLRAHRELLELRAEQLRFEAGEAADMLRGVVGVTLTGARSGYGSAARRSGPQAGISPGCRWPVAPKNTTEVIDA
jgi:hypothetical protein